LAAGRSETPSGLPMTTSSSGGFRSARTSKERHQGSSTTIPRWAFRS
jgi:hypothetical protein